MLAWDCATGNGQAAVELATVFDRVIATDASERQIANAEPRPRVEYRVGFAEESGLKSGAVDLVLVAQALHWFDLERFYGEVGRVLKPRGIFAASAYRFFHISPAVDELVNCRYYRDVVGPFWPGERALIERFEEIRFPFPELSTPPFEMRLDWTLDHLVGYLRSWSATQRFVTANQRDPLDDIAQELQTAWGNPRESRTVTWPLTLRAAIQSA